MVITKKSILLFIQGIRLYNVNLHLKKESMILSETLSYKAEDGNYKDN